MNSPESESLANSLRLPPVQGEHFTMATDMVAQCKVPSSDSLVVEESLVPLLEHLRIQLRALREGSSDMGVALVKPPRWKGYEKADPTMLWVDRRRLDNIIWRAWYLHYMFGKTTRYIEFADEEKEREAASMSYPILEGQEDQQGIMKMKSCYQSWRQYWKNRISQGREQQDSEYMQDIDGMEQDARPCTADQMFLDDWSHSVLELGKLSDWMNTIPDTLFTSLRSPQDQDVMMDLGQETFKEYTQPKNVGNLLKNGISGSYHDFLSTQLNDQQLFPGLSLASTCPTRLMPPSLPMEWGRRRNTQVERARVSVGPETRSAPYGQPRPKEHPTREPSDLEPIEEVPGVSLLCATPESLETPETPLQWTLGWGLGGAGSAAATPDSGRLSGTLPDSAAQYSVPGSVDGGRVSWTLGGDTSDEDDKDDMSDAAAANAMEAKRAAHILAEQKRRNNIRMGFEELQRVIPNMHGAAYGQKMSKAMVLQLTMEHIHTLEVQRQQLTQEATRLREVVNTLQLGLSQAQGLPSASVAQDTEGWTAKRLYSNHMEACKGNTKLCLFHMMFEPLLDSFLETVLVDRPESMGVSFSTWCIHHCTQERLKVCAAIALHRLAQTQPVTGDAMANPHDLATVAAMATFAQANQGPPPLPWGVQGRMPGMQAGPTAAAPGLGPVTAPGQFGFPSMAPLAMNMGALPTGTAPYPVQQRGVIRGDSCPNMFSMQEPPNIERRKSFR